MSTIAVILGLSVLGALAIVALLAALTPQRSDLVSALRAPRTPILSAGPVVAVTLREGRWRPWEQWRRWAETRLAAVAWLRAPDVDLNVLNLSRGTFLLLQVGAALLGLLVGPLYGAVFAVLGVPGPIVISGVVGLILAVVLWITVGAVVHSQAQARRRVMRYAIWEFLVVVAIRRFAGEAMGQALLRTAADDTTWPFRVMHRRMQTAVRGGSSEWAGLSELAHEFGVEELTGLADIAKIGGTSGGSVYSTLMARAQSLGRELQVTEEEQAVAASSRLAFPKVLLTSTLAAFLLFPALLRLLQ